MKKLFYILFLLCPLFFYAQINVEFTKENFKNDKDGLKAAKSFLEEGDLLMKQGPNFYAAALEPYLKAQQFNPNNALLNFKIGKCYLKSATRLSAIPYLEKAFTISPNIDKEIRFLMAQAYHYNYQWDKAISEYEAYRFIVNPDAGSITDEVKAINKKIEECMNGKILVQKPVRVFIDNIGKEINSPYADYNPVINGDETVIIFTSRRENTIGKGKDPSDNRYFEDNYIAYKVNGKWQEAVNMGASVNTESHDAVSFLSVDGQTLITYHDRKGEGGIYISYLKGDKWTEPEMLGKNINGKHHESTACLSPDGNSLYFVSNRPEGSQGGRDIWVSKKDKKGRWGEAQNLGKMINSAFDEEAVFMHPDGKTLYFSSRGHNTMGGFDLFKANFENGEWKQPENLGYPLNTPDDDLFFTISADGKHGYYSSFNSKTGMGEKDIYVVTFLGPEKEPVLSTEDDFLPGYASTTTELAAAPKVEIKTVQMTLLKGTVTDALTQKPVEAVIELTDNQRNELIASFTSNSKTGKYLVSLPAGKNYGIAVKAENYLFHSENFDIAPSAGYQEVVKDIQLKNVQVGSSIVLRNIFFDSDKSTLKNESTAELERLYNLLKETSSLKIEIAGHTDNKGSAEYNQKLSDARAKAVVDYLITKGITADRLQYKGYGMTQPVASNDDEMGRQMNRRTEFKILSK